MNELVPNLPCSFLEKKFVLLLERQKSLVLLARCRTPLGPFSSMLLVLVPMSAQQLDGVCNPFPCGLYTQLLWQAAARVASVLLQPMEDKSEMAIPGWG